MQVIVELMNKIVVVDFSGTLVKPFVAEQANLKRYDLLGIPRPSLKDQKKHHATKEHYDIIKEFIEKQFGISNDMKINFRNNYAKEVSLSGKDIKTMIMTDLFRNSMYLVAVENKLNIYADGILDALNSIQKKGYKLAIVSGIRTDIITGIFEITNCPVKFDYIYGQDPVLSRDSNETLNNELSKEGKICYLIGDKLSDLEPAKKLKAKTIFVKWGHSSGGEEDFADYSINKAEELNKII